MNLMNVSEEVVEENRRMCEDFPFLIPTNRWTGEVVDNFDYSWTELDAMEDGWRIAFGLQFCEELKAALAPLGEKAKTFRFAQIKEKWGMLCVYCNWYTDEIQAVIRKYESMSKNICILCGEPAEYYTKGWIAPICHKCAIDRFNNRMRHGDRKFENMFTKIHPFDDKEEE